MVTVETIDETSEVYLLEKEEERSRIFTNSFGVNSFLISIDSLVISHGKEVLHMLHFDLPCLSLLKHNSYDC